MTRPLKSTITTLYSIVYIKYSPIECSVVIHVHVGIYIMYSPYEEQHNSVYVCAPYMYCVLWE